MHKRMTGALSMLFAGAMAGAVALGGCSSMNLPNASKYEPASIEVEGWKASIAGANVVFNTSTQSDDLVVYVDVTNNTNQASAPQAHLLVSAVQGNTTLVGSSLAQEAQDKDNQKATTSEAEQEQDDVSTSLGTSTNFAKSLQPKESTRAVFSYDLNDSSDVQIVVEPIVTGDEDSSPEAIESKTQRVTFKVDGLQTAESKKAAEDHQQKLLSNSVTIAGAKADIADGYRIESLDDTSCDIVKDGGSPRPLIRLTNSTTQGDAQTWANNFRNSYPNASEMDTVTINGVNYLRFFPVPDQFQLYADCPSGGVLQVYGMFTSYDAVMDQLGKISLV